MRTEEDFVIEMSKALGEPHQPILGSVFNRFM
jgi:hypothetical protein